MLSYIFRHFDSSRKTAVHQSRKDDPITIFDNSGYVRLLVPGFGCKLETVLPTTKRFRHGIMDASYDRLTAKEISMLHLMDAITDKPNWKMKVRNPKIVEKWRAEVMKMPFMSDAAFDWCIEELQDSTDWDDNSFVLTLNTGSRCAKGDDVIPESILKDLQSQVLPLLQRPKDWHPDSKEQVLDLVHPSLYPLVYEKTRIKPRGTVKLNEVVLGDKTTVVLPSIIGPPLRRSSGWSYRFQWLPCEVQFQEDLGTKVKITSYINNLRPDINKELYQTIEQVIGLSIPAWNQVLLRSSRGRTSQRIRVSGLTYEPPLPEWFKDLARRKGGSNWEDDLRKVKQYCRLPEITLSADVDHRHRQFLHDEAMIYRGPGPFDWEDWDKKSISLQQVVAAKHLHLQKVVHPDPRPDTYREWKEKQWDARTWDTKKHLKKHEEPNPYPVSLENEFRKQGLQVIVKLAGIELTPENPEYPGGNWHLEGSLSEHIVATAIYYFDVQNVSESRIRFRQEVTLDTDIVRRDQWPDLTDFAEIWGVSVRDLEYDAAAVQAIGSIKTPQGRLLAFPNTLQHRVEPFRLVDSTKPGHRRSLVLWLVDPNYRIMSTRNVPPQQAEWQSDAALTILRHMRKPKLPPEVLAIIGEKLDEVAPFPLRTAKKIRAKLMMERGVLKQDVNEATPRYSLCEH